MQIADTSAHSGFTLIRIPCRVEVICKKCFFEMKPVASVTKLIAHPIVAHCHDHCLCRGTPPLIVTASLPLPRWGRSGWRADIFAWTSSRSPAIGRITRMRLVRAADRPGSAPRDPFGRDRFLCCSWRHGAVDRRIARVRREMIVICSKKPSRSRWFATFFQILPKSRFLR
jgi:hypothetical protein